MTKLTASEAMLLGATRWPCVKGSFGGDTDEDPGCLLTNMGRAVGIHMHEFGKRIRWWMAMLDRFPVLEHPVNGATLVYALIIDKYDTENQSAEQIATRLANVEKEYELECGAPQEPVTETTHDPASITA